MSLVWLIGNHWVVSFKVYTLYPITFFFPYELACNVLSRGLADFHDEPRKSMITVYI